MTAIGGTTIASRPVETARTTFAPLLRVLGLCCGGGKGEGEWEWEWEGCEEVDGAEEREEEDGAEEEEEVGVVDEAEEALLCSLLEGR